MDRIDDRNSLLTRGEPLASDRGVSVWLQAVSLLVTGLGIGWLVGLSASPVIGGVIASLLSIAAGIVVTLPAMTGKTTSADARPAALLVLGIALGAPGGVVTRTYRLLEPSEVRQTEPRLTEAESRGVLFGARVPQCTQLQSYWIRGEKELFVAEFASSTLPKAAKLASSIHDPETLHQVMEALCAG